MRNDPAFGFSASPSLHDCSPGLTKREYFAAMAMQALITKQGFLAHEDSTATQAIAHADAMILHLEKSK